MRQIILAAGPPPLTQDAADAALDAIDFIAAAVRGYDAIDVTDVVRPLWRSYVTNAYPYLDPATRQWFATAPQLLMAIQTQWPVMHPLQQNAMRQQWAMQLPQMLAMVDPVLQAAQALEMQEAQRAALASWRQQAAPYARNTFQQGLDAVEQLNQHAQTTEMLRNYSTTMANSTIDLMRAMNRR